MTSCLYICFFVNSWFFKIRYFSFKGVTLLIKYFSVPPEVEFKHFGEIETRKGSKIKIATCIAKNSHPAAEIQWRDRDGNIFDGVMEQLSSATAENGLSSVINTLEVDKIKRSSVRFIVWIKTYLLIFIKVHKDIFFSLLPKNPSPARASNVWSAIALELFPALIRVNSPPR